MSAHRCRAELSHDHRQGHPAPRSKRPFCFARGRRPLPLYPSPHRGRLIADGILKARKAGRRVLVDMASIRAYYESLPVIGGTQ